MQNMIKKPFTLDRIIRLLIGLSITLLFFWLIQRLSNVLLPFLISWLLAYLLQPIVNFFQHKMKLKSRLLSVMLTLLMIGGVVIGGFMLLYPMVISEVDKFTYLITTSKFEFNVDSILPRAWQDDITNYVSHLNINSILHDENIMNGAKNLFPQIWNIVGLSIDLIVGMVTLIIMMIYLILILLDYENIAEGRFAIIPPKYRTIVNEIITDLELGMSRYFRGQALIALIVGVLFIIGFLIIKLPLAIVLGIMIGVLNLVPYLKAISLIPVALMGLLQSAETNQNFFSILLGIAIVFIVIQMIEDLIIVPKVMGKVTGLNPAVILLSLSVWGSLLGVAGMIIALPMTTLIISYYKRFVLNEINEEAQEVAEKDE